MKLGVGIFVVIVILATAFFAFDYFNEELEEIDYNENDERNIESSYINEYLPNCNDIFYTTPFVEIEKINEITPLGNTEPPSHTIPTNHVYVHLFNQGEQTETLPLIAPADIWITEILSSQGYLDPEDYSIRFALCKDVFGYFNHVKFLSTELQEILKKEGCSGGNDCFIQPLKPIRIIEGSYLGEVGRLQGNFDFGTFDLRETHDFINSDRYGDRTLHIQCGFDYYTPELREQFMGLLEEESEGNCGKTNYDILGTLQGNWFNGNSYEFLPETWNQHLYFGYDNTNPSLAVISIGGVFVDEPVKWLYLAQESGTTNLNPGKVSIGETIYCYERTEDGPGYRYRGVDNGKILIKLVNNMEIKIEYQKGDCSGDLAFKNPTEYKR